MSQNAYDLDKFLKDRKQRKTIGKLVLAAVIAIALIVLVSESCFVVGEAEQCVISRFGVIQSVILNDDNRFHANYAEALKGEITSGDSVRVLTGGGLHFKMPFVDTVQTFPSRLYTYVGDSEVVNTAEKKQYYVQTFAQWSIADPALFSLKLGSTVRCT